MKLTWYADIEFTDRREPNRGVYVSKTWCGEIPEGPRARIDYPQVDEKVKLAVCSFWESARADHKYCCAFGSRESAEAWAEALLEATQRRGTA